MATTLLDLWLIWIFLVQMQHTQICRFVNYACGDQIFPGMRRTGHEGEHSEKLSCPYMYTHACAHARAMLCFNAPCSIAPGSRKRAMLKHREERSCYSQIIWTLCISHAWAQYGWPSVSLVWVRLIIKVRVMSCCICVRLPTNRSVIETNSHSI